MWGLEHSSLTTRKNEIRAMTTVSRLSRYSYGLSLSNDYDPTQHLPIDKYYDEHEGTWKAGNQMTWLLKRVMPISSPMMTDVKTQSRAMKLKKAAFSTLKCILLSKLVSCKVVLRASLHLCTTAKKMSYLRGRRIVSCP